MCERQRWCRRPQLTSAERQHCWHWVAAAVASSLRVAGAALGQLICRPLLIGIKMSRHQGWPSIRCASRRAAKGEEGSRSRSDQPSHPPQLLPHCVQAHRSAIYPSRQGVCAKLRRPSWGALCTVLRRRSITPLLVAIRHHASVIRHQGRKLLGSCIWAWAAPSALGRRQQMTRLSSSCSVSIHCP